MFVFNTQDRPPTVRDGTLPGCQPSSCPPGITALSGNSMPLNPGGFCFSASRRDCLVSSTLIKA